MPINRQQAEGSGLTFILAIAALGMAFIGIGIASKANTTANLANTTANKACSPSTLFKKCQLWASGNITLLLPIGTITTTADVAFPNAPSQPTVNLVLQNDTDNQLDSQIGPIAFYMGAARSLTLSLASSELWGSGTHESETVCDFAYLCVGSIITGACTFYTIVTAIASVGNAHLRIQFSPDLTNWYDFLSDTTPIAQGGDIVVSTTGLQFNQAGQGVSHVNMTALNTFQIWNAPMALRVISFGATGTITLGNIWFSCINPNTQQFFYSYNLVDFHHFTIIYNSAVPVPWVTGNINYKFPIRFTWQVWVNGT